MKYSDFKLSIKKTAIIAQTPFGEISVSSYLPIEDKIDLIEIALQKSEENGIYNEMKLEMYFNLYIIYMYTNFEFSPEDKQDEYKLYNELESNGIITSVISVLNEYEDLLHYLEIMKKSKLKQKNSVTGLLQTFIQDMPKNAETMSEIVDNFDKEKYKEVIDFARYANGGRAIGQK